MSTSSSLPPHKSNSAEQRSAEVQALAQLNLDLKLNLNAQVISLRNTSRVQIDGYDETGRVICEIYARIGKLKGSQPDKLASDILKLLLIERQLGGTWRKIICFVDDTAAHSLNNASWLASTCKLFSIEVHIVQISAATKQSIVDAQTRQKMVNDYTSETGVIDQVSEIIVNAEV